MKKITCAKKFASIQENATSVSAGEMPGEHEARHGIFVGLLIGLNRDSLPVVRLGCEMNRKPLVCGSIVEIDERSLGREVVVQFENGDLSRPIIMGILRNAGVPEQGAGANSDPAAKRFIEVDGERLLLAGDREIVLQCGDARITLTKAGKIIIHGNYVLTRSRGACKLKGATVDIN